MHLVMFDIDGTLIRTCDFDEACYYQAVSDVTGLDMDTNWETYKNITDSGILDEFITQNGLHERRKQVHRQVKEQFTRLVSDGLRKEPPKEIEGAIAFLDLLKSRGDVEVAIATGGWEEAAKLKLASAGFYIDGLPFASSSDHFARTSVMLTAEARCRHREFVSKTYFGDGRWDKTASDELGYNFILVGNKFEHDRQVDHYTDADRAMFFIGI